VSGSFDNFEHPAENRSNEGVNPVLRKHGCRPPTVFELHRNVGSFVMRFGRAPIKLIEQGTNRKSVTSVRHWKYQRA
jgi:hypothetical protein